MKQRSLFLFFSFAVLLSMTLFSSSFAQLRPGTATTAGGSTNPAANDSTSSTNPAADCAPNCPETGGLNTAGEFPLQIKLKNPLKVNSIQDAIELFMDAVVKIAIPFIVVFFIWSGIQFILARGNATKIKEAKSMFWNTVIGTLLILGAWAITDAIVGTINSIAS